MSRKAFLFIFLGLAFSAILGFRVRALHSQSVDRVSVQVNPLESFELLILRIEESNLTSTAITVGWSVDEDYSRHRVLYGKDADLADGQWSEWQTNTSEPKVTIRNLDPNKTYYYTCESHNPERAHLVKRCPLRTFTTLPAHVTWHVDDDGVDKPDADFASVLEAIEAADDGDAILVYPGVYPGKIVLEKSLNLTGIGWPTLDGQGAGGNIELDSEGSVIQGFRFSGTGTSSRLAYVIESGTQPARQNIIRNNKFDSWLYAIHLGDNAQSNLITDNLFTISSVDIVAGDYNDITFNDFYDDGSSDLSSSPFDFVSIRAEGNYANYNPAVGNTFENNLCSARGRGCISTFQNTESTSIRSNIVYESFEGIRVRGKNSSITDNIVLGRGTPLDSSGIEIYNADSTLVERNSISHFTIGLRIRSEHNMRAFTNTRMRDNSLENNQFNFVLDPGPVVYSNQPFPEVFEHDIDPSNTVDGRSIYYLRDISDATLDPNTLPNAGLVICVHCVNIVVKDLKFERNSHGILFYDVSQAVIENVLSSRNLLSGIGLYSSHQITVRNSVATNNGRSSFEHLSAGIYGDVGIFLGRSRDVSIENCSIDNNRASGISLVSSDRNHIVRSTISDNNTSGIFLSRSESNTIRDNVVSQTMAGGQKHGVHLAPYTENNLIFNNIFDNETNAYAHEANQWNVSKTAGTNIVGGPYIGGNFWGDYGGSDVNGDLIGDTNAPYNAGGEIEIEGDHLPLLSPESTMPVLEITSPVEKDYTDRSIPVNFVFSGDLVNAHFSLDGGERVKVDEAVELERLLLGEHTLNLYVEDTEHLIHETSVDFRVVPLALYPGQQGTPEFTDEIVYEFVAKPLDYVLAFEARNASQEPVGVHLNKHLVREEGQIGESALFDDAGRDLGVIPPESDWAAYEFRIISEDLVIDLTNYLAFLYQGPSPTGTDAAGWAIRDLSLHPIYARGAPNIQLTSSRALSADKEMAITAEIAYIEDPERFKVFIYVVDPAGRSFYYPDWSETETALDSYFLKNNHAGKLPATLSLSGDAVPGQYTLVGELAEEGNENQVVSLSTFDFYYNPETAVKNFVDREIYSEGDILNIHVAVTEGDVAKGELTVSLEDPMGEKIYIPGESQTVTTIEFSPLRDRYLTVFSGLVDGSWLPGTYVVRSSLFNESGNQVSHDFLTFDVCGAESAIQGSYALPGNADVIMEACQIFLVDAFTLSFPELLEVEEEHSDFYFPASAGDYFLSGYCQDAKRNRYKITTRPISLGCGEVTEQNINLEKVVSHIGDASMDSQIIYAGYPHSVPHEHGQEAVTDPASSIDMLQQENKCRRKPGVFVVFDIGETAADIILEYYDEFEADAERLATYIDETLMSSLDDAAEIKLTSSKLTWEAIYKQRDLIANKVEAKPDLSALRTRLAGVDYIYWMNIYFMGDAFHIYSGFTDAATGLILNDTWIDEAYYDFDSLMKQIVDRQAKRIGDLLPQHEDKYANPPREPTVTTWLSQPAVSLQNPVVDVFINLTDCYGNPVYFRDEYRVNFPDHSEKYGNLVGWDTATSRGRRSPGVYDFDQHTYGATTNEAGTAVGTYTLKPRDQDVILNAFNAGKDSFTISYMVRPRQLEYRTVVIPISGTRIEVTSQENEIGKFEATPITITLSEIDEYGTEMRRVAGETIYVSEASNLLDGVISIPDGQDQIVTNENGEATIIFKAGKKLGKVRITAVYEPKDGQIHIIDSADLLVTSEEFLLTVKWYECIERNLRGILNSPSLREVTSSYCFQFRSNTVWDRISGREQTDAFLRFTEDSDIWHYSGWDYEAPWGIADAWVERTWLSTSHIFSHTSSESTNTVVKDWSDTLLVSLDPLPIPLILDGIHTYDYSYNDETTSQGWTMSFDFTDNIYYPPPMSYASCILQSVGTHAPACSLWEDSSFADMALDLASVRLEKTGKWSYRDYHYDYYQNRSNRVYNTFEWGYGSYLEPGEFYFEDTWNLCFTDGSCWFEPMPWWTYFLVWETERSFDVTVINR